MPENTPITEAPTPTNRGSVRLDVTNASDGDVQFIRNVVSLFTDPAYESQANAFRQGERCLTYHGRGGLHTQTFTGGKR